jgi:uncharacterized protein YbaP (TraB family)
VLYLAGSVHALGADSYPLSAAYESAFNSSGTLVEEINLAEAEQLAAAPLLLSKGLYTDGRTFESAVGKDTATLVATRLKTTGIPMEMIRTMKPWMVMLLITAFEAQKAGLDAALGLDKYFSTRHAPQVSRCWRSRLRSRKSIASTRCRKRCRSRCCEAR